MTTFSIEGLRVSPLAIAFLRRFIGPNLTEKERSTPYMGLSPLNEPDDFPHADFLSNMVLFFVIFLVYATIAPLVSFILALCFIIMGTLFRHHFVYIYNAQPDSGGFLYLNFMKILMTCLLIGEITVSGLLTLKKAAAATPMMLPLIITTVRRPGVVSRRFWRLLSCSPCLVTIGLVQCLHAPETSHSGRAPSKSIVPKAGQEECKEREHGLLFCSGGLFATRIEGEGR